MTELVKKLETIGFTSYESKVFIALIKGYNMTASEVAEQSGVPRTSVYDILKSFAERGYCNEIETPTKLRYEIIDPQIIEGKLENEFNNKHKKQLTELKTSFEKMKPMFNPFIDGLGEPDVQVLRGFNKFRVVKFIELLQKAEKEVLIMNRLEGHISPELDDTAKEFYKKGGVVKSLYESSTNFKFEKDNKWYDVTKQDFVNLLDGFSSQGEQVKLLDRVPINVTIFDRKIVFFSLVDYTTPKNNRTDLIVRNPEYAEFLCELFELYWKRAETLETYKSKNNII